MHVPTLRSTAKTIAIGLAQFALLLALNPLDLASSTTKKSEELINRLISLTVDDKVARHVSVVLVDDRSAPAINGDRGYPITFAQHASILRPVLCSNAAGLFIDMTFRGIRSDAPRVEDGGIDPELGELIDVLGGKGQDYRDYCARLDPTWSAPTKPAQVVIGRASSHGGSDCDPLFSKPPGDDCAVGRQLHRIKDVALPSPVTPVADDGSYPVVVFDPDAGKLVASPALEMVFAFCDRAPQDVRGALAGCRDRTQLAALAGAEAGKRGTILYPAWSYFQSRTWLADQAKHSAPRESGKAFVCPPAQALRDAPLFAKLAIGANELWNTLVGFDDDSGASFFGHSHCLAQDTFGAIDVRQMTSFCGSEGAACAERLAAFFAGRMVFYGVDITGINDKVPSPVLGSVPGVSFHATAAENLLRFGVDFPSAPTEAGVFSKAFWLNCAAYLLALLAVAAGNFAMARPTYRTAVWWLSAGVFALAVASFVAAAIGPPLPSAAAGAADGAKQHLAVTKLAAGAAILAVWFSALVRMSKKMKVAQAVDRDWSLALAPLTMAFVALSSLATASYAFGWPAANVIGVLLMIAVIDRNVGRPARS